jgi:uncharacterized protein DUF4760
MIGAGVWRQIRDEWPAHHWKMLEVLALAVTAAAAFAIPIILERAAIQRHHAEIATRTLLTMNDVNRQIGKVLTEYPTLRTANSDDPSFSYEVVIKDERINSQLINLLNEYEHVCLGGNKGLLDSEIMSGLRGHAIRDTWNQFKNYILGRRAARQDQKVWNECEDWLNKNKIEGWKKW